MKDLGLPEFDKKSSSFACLINPSHGPRIAEDGGLAESGKGKSRG